MDKGLSAYAGEHRAKEAFGIFLELIDKGEIEQGSLLIVEHLDHISREGLLEASHMMMGILLKGIDLYTAIDKKYFQKSKFSIEDLIISAAKFEQAHQESKIKSFRVSKAWVNKRSEKEKERERIFNDEKGEEDEDTRKYLRGKLKEMLAELKELDEAKKRLEVRVTQLTNAPQEVEGQLKNIDELIEHMARLEGQARIDLRFNLQDQLQQLIHRIDISKHINISRGEEYYTVGYLFKPYYTRRLTISADGEVKEGCFARTKPPPGWIHI